MQQKNFEIKIVPYPQLWGKKEKNPDGRQYPTVLIWLELSFMEGEGGWSSSAKEKEGGLVHFIDRNQSQPNR